MLDSNELAIMIDKRLNKNIGAIIARKEERMYQISDTNDDCVRVEKSVFPDFGLALNSVEYNDWLNKNHFRMARGKKYIAIVKQQ